MLFEFGDAFARRGQRNAEAVGACGQAAASTTARYRRSEARSNRFRLITEGIEPPQRPWKIA